MKKPYERIELELIDSLVSCGYGYQDVMNMPLVRAMRLSTITAKRQIEEHEKLVYAAMSVNMDKKALDQWKNYVEDAKLDAEQAIRGMF